MEKNNRGGSYQLKSRKAFTLIELLAVIVILVIIALIAVPIILNIIEDTKKSVVLRSAEMYVHGIEIDIINEQLNKKEIDYSLKIGNYIVNYNKENNKSIISGEIKKAEPSVYLIEGTIQVQYKNNNV